MTELPGTDWRAEPWAAAEALALAPMLAAWQPAGQVRHGFTHFELTIDLFAARVERIEAAGSRARSTHSRTKPCPRSCASAFTWRAACRISRSCLRSRAATR